MEVEEVTHCRHHNPLIDKLQFRAAQIVSICRIVVKGSNMRGTDGWSEMREICMEFAVGEM